MLSLVERKWGRKYHYVFKMRGPSEIYLGPKDDPRPEKVREALKYVDQLKAEYEKHYDDLRDQLLDLLPKGKRESHVS